MSLPDGELDGVGRCGDDGLDGLFQVFDALEEAAFIEEAVVNSNVEATIGARIEQPIQPVKQKKR